MTIIARMLKYLFWVLIVSSTVAMLRKIVGNMAVGDAGSKPGMDVPNSAVNQKLVRDPVSRMCENDQRLNGGSCQFTSVTRASAGGGNPCMSIGRA